eukprot:jgi/Botrbrau1/8876/Bobra.50_2s0031.2
MLAYENPHVGFAVSKAPFSLQGRWKSRSVFILLVLAFVGPVHAIKQKDWHLGLDEFFKNIDIDGDGQVGPAEAKQYIGKMLGTTHEGELRDAVVQMTANLDGTDQGNTISEKEVEEHLKKLKQGYRVAEWIKHGLGLPQYVDNFRANAITSLDFPILVNDGGETLRNDLGISSKLHRQQIIRAIQRMILGLGSPPSAPRDLWGKPLTCDSIAVSWQIPLQLGSPPMHKYKLERRRTDESKWVTAHGDLDDGDESWTDTGLEVGDYQYRLTAWNSMGWSDFAMSNVSSTANASLPCPRPACEKLNNCVREPAGSSSSSWNNSSKGDKGEVQRLGFLQLTLTGLGLSVAAVFLTTVGMFLYPLMFSGARGAPGVAPVQHARDGKEIATQDSLGKQGSIGTPRSSGKTVTFQDLPPVQRGYSDVNRGSGILEGQWEAAARTAMAIVDPPPVAKGPMPVSKSLQNLPSNASSQGRTKVDLWLRDASGTSRRHYESIPSSSGSPYLAEEANGYDLDVEPDDSEHVNRHRCAYPGCHRRFSRLRYGDMKHAMYRHYCALCQKVYCQYHTAYSPHGPLVGCDLESKCICMVDWATLNTATRDRLEKTNRISHRDRDKDKSQGNSESSKSMKLSSSSSKFRSFGAGLFGLGGGNGAPRESSNSELSAAESSETNSRHAIKPVGTEGWQPQRQMP